MRVRGNWIRWTAAVLMLLGIAMIIVSPAQAEVNPLGMAMEIHGRPLDPAGWDDPDHPTEYRDESIHVVLQSETTRPKGSAESVAIRWVTVEITDPSQLRTTMAYETYGDKRLTYGTEMSQSVNAVFAINGDFIKYYYTFGYVIRQGVFYRDMLEKQKYPRDVLVIDTNGDFTIVPKATTADMEAKIAELEADGRGVVNTFTFGPALIKDGEIQDIDRWPEFEAWLVAKRICICQLGPLKYAVVQVDGGDGSGMTFRQLAELVKEKYPECIVAYNLDGGQSTNLILNNQQLSRGSGRRKISDIIYFASAAGEEP